jgi:predicted nucleic acid-binding protein
MPDPARMRSPANVLYKQVALIDTSAAVALHNAQESNHIIAKQFFDNEKALLWTSLDVTAHETFTRVRYDVSLAKAIGAFDFLRTRPIRFVSFDRQDEQKARSLLNKFSDHKISFHDALCAAVMLRLGIFKVFTFDKDFLILGFDKLPAV